MDQGSDPHCMGCKQGWSREETITAIGKSYYNKEYKEHRKNTMFDTEKARFPETMPVVERKVKENNIREDIRKIENEVSYNYKYNNKREKEKKVFIKNATCEFYLNLGNVVVLFYLGLSRLLN